MPSTICIGVATDEELTNSTYSDGIARVHGMSNVQAEELVECVSFQSIRWSILTHILGSHPVSRACA